jgi:hypothetical protein
MSFWREVGQHKLPSETAADPAPTLDGTTIAFHHSGSFLDVLYYNGNGDKLIMMYTSDACALQLTLVSSTWGHLHAPKPVGRQ